MSNIVELAAEAQANTENVKQDIINSLNDKGVEVDNNAEMVDLAEYVEEVKANNGNGPDLENFYTKDQIDNSVIPFALKDYAKKEDIPDTEEILTAEDLEPYAKTEDLKDYLKKEDLPGDGEFLTAEDLEPYAKTEDLEAYLKKEDLPGDGEFITAEDLEPYAKTEDLKAYLKKEEMPASYFPVGMVFEHSGTLPPAGAFILDGQIISNCEGVYPTFFNYVKNSGNLTTAEEYESCRKTKGYCKKFVISGSDVRLWDFKGYQSVIKPRTLGVHGDGKVIGLTDGSGNYGLYWNSSNGLNARGKLYQSASGSNISKDVKPTTGLGLGLAKSNDGSGIVADLNLENEESIFCIQVFNTTKELSEQESAQLSVTMQNKMDKNFGNAVFSQNIKQQIINYSVPDYKKPTIFLNPAEDFDATDEQSFTVPADGVLNVCLFASSQSAYMIIDDITLFQGSIDNATVFNGNVARYYAFSGQYIVRKGSVVRYKCTTYNSTARRNMIIFYPYKGSSI